MDSIELARQVAAELHSRLVADGANPWAPYEFVLAEARRRNIDVERASVGAVILNGGRATFSAKDQLIVHEDAGTRFEQAFIVAHEIGHAALGDGGAYEVATVIDPARAAEAAPIGVERVVDYGRRQRREVQMDLFARELLLPRPVARSLHVEQMLSVSDIAARLGAPIEVVAQQLFDALLLPVVPPAAPRNDAEHPLNPEQATAAGHRGPAYLLEAGPGTGKTQTLIARVEGLLSDGVDPRQILLLTFSNKAAGEMAERVARKRPDAAAAMWIGTFHSFGLDLIRRFYSELGLPKDPRLMDKTEAVELLEEEFPRLKLKHYQNLYDPTQHISDILRAISRAKDEVVDAAEYASLAEAMLVTATNTEAREIAERALEVARVYAAYEELKRASHCVDFGDLVELPVRLLERRDAIRATLQAQYRHILVDEYQDVNRGSVRLLGALCSTGENLWVVGDSKQSIYRFRGASEFNIERFGREDFPGGARGRLEINYRSVPEIVESYSRFMGASQPSGRVGLVADRRSLGSQPELFLTPTAEQQQLALAEVIEQLRLAGNAYRDQAVLCTGNEKLADTAVDLERLGVPVLFLGSLFERPEVKDLLALLSLLVDKRAMGLLRVACWPEFTMSLSDVAAVLDHLRETDSGAATWLLDVGSIAGVSTDGQQSLAKLATTLAGIETASSPWNALATVLLERTRIAADLSTSTSTSDRSRGIAMWQLLNFLKRPLRGHGLPITRVLDRVRRLVRLGDDHDLRQLPAVAQHLDAVRLMTIHGAKGLEFGAVHVPGLNADTIPRAATRQPCPPPDGMITGSHSGHLAEQDCLFYVAMSRARDRLVLYAPTTRSDGKSRSLSPFVDRLGTSLTRRKFETVGRLPVADEAKPVALLVDGSLRFEVSQIALYESCPRRFFYTYVLQIGGRRGATGYVKLHDAVRSVVTKIIASSTPATDRELVDLTDAALDAHGLVDHGYRAEFRAFALAMLRFFVKSRAGSASEPNLAVRLVVNGEEILVESDEVLLRPDGVRAVRRVQTGHLRSNEDGDVSAAALMLAVRQAFPDAIAELVHLSDGQTRTLSLTERKLATRRDTLEAFLGEIRAGRFPAKASSYTCSNCPAFYICGPTPVGPLRKKFV